MTVKQRARDLKLARRAKRHGMQNSLRIVMEARAAGLPISLAFALVQQESGNGANVFGHDPTIFVGAGNVTKAKYLAYKNARGHTRMQGVGPVQLTWYGFQDQADAMGGCWQPKYNLRVGFQHLAHLIAQKGERAGIKAYNGSGDAADHYASSVLSHKATWHRRLA